MDAHETAMSYLSFGYYPWERAKDWRLEPTTEAIIAAGGLGDFYVQMLPVLHVCPRARVYYCTQAPFVDYVRELAAALGLNITIIHTGAAPSMADAMRLLREKLPDAVMISIQIGNGAFRFPRLPEAPLSLPLPRSYLAVGPVAGTIENPRRLKTRQIIPRDCWQDVVLIGKTPLGYESLPGSLDLVNRLSLAQTIAVIRRATLYVGYPGFLSMLAASQRVHCVLQPDHQRDWDVRVMLDWRPFYHYLDIDLPIRGGDDLYLLRRAAGAGA